jgi:uncharacterized protein
MLLPAATLVAARSTAVYVGRRSHHRPALSAADLSLLALGALLIGFAKTAIGGVSSISIALFAAVLPARESTGAVLPLLMAGDVFALQAYRAHAQWARLIRLFPSVAVGVVAGAVFVSLVDDTVMRRTIGAVLLSLVLLTVWRRRTGSHDGAVSEPTGAAGGGWPAAPATGRWPASQLWSRTPPAR